MLRIAEALEMHDFSGAEKLDYIVNIRIIREPEYIVICYAGFLLSSEILRQIGYCIALHRHTCGAPGKTGSSGGVNSCGPVNKIGIKARGFDLLIAEIPRKLMDDSPDHFKVPQLFRA